MTDDASDKTKGDLNMPNETVRSDLCLRSQNISKCSSFTIDSLLSDDKKPQSQIVQRVNVEFPGISENFDGSCDNAGISDGLLSTSASDVYNASPIALTGSRSIRCLNDESKLDDNVFRRNQRDSELYHRNYSDGKLESSNYSLHFVFMFDNTKYSD